MYIPVLLGTVREGRRSEWVARWVVKRLRTVPGLDVELIDPREWPFDNLVTREWEMDPQPPRVAEFVAKMARADGFVIVSPEYNFGYPGTLKNMLDALYDEWSRKPFALVGVGGMSGGLRMIEHLRGTIAGLGAITVPSALSVGNVARSWDEDGPHDGADWEKRFDSIIEEFTWYALALKAARDAP